MTTNTLPASAGRSSRSRTGLWIALAALVVGAVVAVVGVRAAVAAYQRDQGIRSYHDARVAATYFTKNGDTISASMRKLQKLDDQDVGLMKAQRVALNARDVSAYNSLTNSANARTEEQQALRNQIRSYQTAFAQAQNH